MNNQYSLRAMLRTALSKPDRQIALQCGSNKAVSLCEFNTMLEPLIETISDLPRYESGPLVIGLAIENRFEWMLANAAILLSDAVVLPVPVEFSDGQLASLLSKCDMCIAQSGDLTQRLQRILPGTPLVDVKGVWTVAYQENSNHQIVPDDIVKIIHTSGTTSSPKGVLIRDAGIAALIQSLLKSFSHLDKIDYLSLVPFSLLIEQVLGVYLPLFSGGKTILKPDALPDFSTQGGMASDYLKWCRPSNANCIFLPPKLLEEMAKILRSNPESINQLLPTPLPFLLTGGAKVPGALMDELDALGVPVYEGYGLSENSSVVSLNTPSNRKLGTVGKPLPHVKIKIVDNEVLVNGSSLCAGYLGQDSSSCEFDANGYLRTGDIGSIDDEGYLSIEGRKKHVIVLSNARNVCPEWVEQIYKQHPMVDDIVVFGEGQETLSATVFNSSDNYARTDIKLALESLNDQLPSFAQVQQFKLYCGQGFRDKFYTVTGRPQRKAIEIDGAGLEEQAQTDNTLSWSIDSSGLGESIPDDKQSSSIEIDKKPTGKEFQHEHA